MVSLSVLRLLEILPIIPRSTIALSLWRLLEWQGFTLSKRSNPIALAMLNYVQAVEATFGLTPEREAWESITMSDLDAKVSS